MNTPRNRLMRSVLWYGMTALLVVAGGCYTSFSTLDPARRAPEPEIIIDSTGDTLKVIREKDTVHITDREVVYWERDLWGRPYARRYRKYYSDDWYSYSYRPWWYDTDFYWDYGYVYPYNSYYYPYSHDYWYYNDRYRHRSHRHTSDGQGSQTPAVSEPRSDEVRSGRSGDGVPATTSSPVTPFAGPRPSLRSQGGSARQPMITVPGGTSAGSTSRPTTVVSPPERQERVDPPAVSNPPSGQHDQQPVQNQGQRRHGRRR